MRHEDSDQLAAHYWANDDDGAAWARVDDTVRDGGGEAVALVELLAATAPDEESLGRLGAGPLEDLVRWHGVALARQLDAASGRQPRLRAALGFVRVGTEHLNAGESLADFFGLS